MRVHWLGLLMEAIQTSLSFSCRCGLVSIRTMRSVTTQGHPHLHFTSGHSKHNCKMDYCVNKASIKHGRNVAVVLSLHLWDMLYMCSNRKSTTHEHGSSEIHPELTRVLHFTWYLEIWIVMILVATHQESRGDDKKSEGCSSRQNTQYLWFTSSSSWAIEKGLLQFWHWKPN